MTIWKPGKEQVKTLTEKYHISSRELEEIHVHYRRFANKLESSLNELTISKIREYEETTEQLKQAKIAAQNDHDSKGAVGKFFSSPARAPLFIKGNKAQLSLAKEIIEELGEHEYQLNYVCEAHGLTGQRVFQDLLSIEKSAYGPRIADAFRGYLYAKKSTVFKDEFR